MTNQSSTQGRRYRAYRGEEYVTLSCDGRLIPLSESLAHRNHSPTGFEFGYAGSGPSQLALAILLDCVGKKLALAFYQDFKFQFVSPEQSDELVIYESEIKEWIQERQRVISG